MIFKNIFHRITFLISVVSIFISCGNSLSIDQNTPDENRTFQLEISSPMDQQKINANTEFLFINPDNLLVEVSLDGESWHDYLIYSGILFGELYGFYNLADGSFELSIRGYDNGNNIVATATVSLIKDTTGPDLEVTYPISGDSVSDISPLRYTTDTTNYPEVRLNNDDWVTCNSNEITFGDIPGFNDLRDGYFHLKIRVKDEMENITYVSIENIIKSVNFMDIELNNPFYEYYTIKGDEPIDLTIKNASSIKISVDNSNYIDFVNRMSFSDITGFDQLEDGDINIYLHGTNSLLGENTKSFTFRKDTTPPSYQLEPSFGKVDNWTYLDFTQEPSDTIFVSLDNSNWTELEYSYIYPRNISGFYDLPLGPFTLYVKAIDPVGNENIKTFPNFEKYIANEKPINSVIITPTDKISVDQTCLNLSKTDSETVTILANLDNGTSFTWYLDGVLTNETGASYLVDSTVLSAGVYRLVVVAYVNTVPYSGEVIITVDYK